MPNATKTSNKAGLHCELSQLQMALAAGLCIAGASAFAQETATLSTVTVKESAAPSVKADEAVSSKFTAPLLDVPMTVEVINETVLQQTGATNLQEALKSVPGITFGNGEGGNPMGDQPFIRGMDAQSSTFIDGIRDIAAGSREVFNLEAIEVIKGADSTYAGRGGAGGSINMSTKKAKNENFINGEVGLGSDNYKRTTLDFNRKLNENTGFRLNAMAHDADVPGRNGPKNKRWGIAPTVTLGMGTPTEVTLSWQHLQTDDIPDGGVPYLYRNAAGSGTASSGNATQLPGGSVVRPTYGGNRNNWYGNAARDFNKEKSDLLTAAVEHKFTETNKFRNTLRHSKSIQQYIWTQPDDSKGNVLLGQVYLRGNSRNSETTTIQNVSEFIGEALTGSVKHNFVVGLDLSKEKSKNVSATGISPPNGTSSYACTNLAAQWCTSLSNPNNQTPTNYTWGTTPNRYKVDTASIYGLDTLKLNEFWLINAGLRLDHYKSSVATVGTSAFTGSRSDNLFNYQVGVVYKPASNGSIYANLSTASRQVGSMLNNGNDDSWTATTPQDLAPEKTKSLEFGTKWDLLDKKMGLTAAIFRNETTNARITDASNSTVMAGKKVVNGFEIGLSGQITSQWSIFGGYTFMDSEQKNAGQTCSGTPAVCVPSVANGQAFPNTPKHSFSLWTSYKPMAKLTLGLGLYAQSEVAQGYVRSSVDPGIVTKGVAGYSRYDAMASYQFNPNVALQVNVYNLTDKVYYSGVRSPHYATMAPGRSAVATLKFTY